MGDNTKTSKMIAVCIPRYWDSDQSASIRSICKKGREHGHKVVVFSTNTDLYYEDPVNVGAASVFELIDVTMYDAIVLFAADFKRDREKDALIEKSKAAGVPIILINVCAKGCYGLTFNFKQSFTNVVEHMIEYHGYRKILYMSGVAGNSFSDDRLDAFKEVLEKNNIPLSNTSVVDGGFWAGSTIEALDSEMAAWKEFPDAIICANDSMAMAVCTRLAEKGIKVPEDIAVSGYDGIELVDYYAPRLTTACCDFKLMFDEVYDMIDKNFEGYGYNTVVDTEVSVGHSCGCTNAKIKNAGQEILALNWKLNSISSYRRQLSNLVSVAAERDKSDSVVAGKVALDRISYKELFICMNDWDWNMLSKINWKANSKSYEERKVFSDTLHYIHYTGDNSKKSEHLGINDAKDAYAYAKKHVKGIEYGLEVQKADVLPDLDKLLEKYGNVLITPMHIRDNVMGYFGMCFDPDDFKFDEYNVYCEYYCDALNYLFNKVRMAELYLTDLITRLYNRNGFFDCVEQLIEQKKNESAADNYITIISIDMDHLKYINDNFGHAVGDCALNMVGKAIIHNGGLKEVCGRIGGDEFLVAMFGEESFAKAELMVEQVKAYLDDYNRTSGIPYEIEISAGIASGPLKDINYEKYVAMADEIMYAEKAKHRARKPQYARK